MPEYTLIFTILNRGFSDLVMDSARESGAKGGTIITARGTGSKVAKKLFGITLSQEKEIILILTPTENKNNIMTAICKSAGLNTQGKGITFSLPVDDVIGIALGINNASGEPSLNDLIPDKQTTGEVLVQPTVPTTDPSETTQNASSKNNTDISSAVATEPKKQTIIASGDKIER